MDWPSVAIVVTGGALLSTFSSPALGSSQEEAVDFNREIRPTLVNNCFKCHGPGASNHRTELRFHTEEKAFADLGGYRAIVPGEPEESELYRRITAEDPDERMPPPDSGLKLTEEQVETFRKWLEQGAEWEPHWAFQAPERPPLPEVDNESWPRNPIDYFVLSRIEAEGLEPSPPADRRTLLRRLSLDLTGLPPTPQQVEQYLNDASPDAYESLIQRLMDSPDYGEHKARYWLDAARYADTHGMHFDNKRSIWPYRDWVVEALNENKRFDEFTIEQLAGDLLEDPSREQLVATGFNRANITSNEGGSIPEELWTNYTIDRTATTGTVWLGLTVGCAQCHDHKYDPIDQEEFYGLYAFFYNMADKPLDGNAPLPPPALDLPSPEQKEKRRVYQEKLSSLQDEIAKAVREVDYPVEAAGGEGDEAVDSGELRETVWVDDALPPGVETSGSDSEWPWVSKPDHPVSSGKKAFRVSGEEIVQQYFNGAKAPLRIGGTDETLFAEVYLDPEDPPSEIMLQFHTDEWDHRAFWGEDRIDWGEAGTGSRRHVGSLPDPGEWVRLEVPAGEVGLSPGDTVDGIAFTQFDGTAYWDRAGLVSAVSQGTQGFDSLAQWERWQKLDGTGSVPEKIGEILDADREERSDEQKRQLRDYFVEHAYNETREIFEPLHQKVAEREKKRDRLEAEIPGTMITREDDDPEAAHRLIRGEYDNPGEEVAPGVPAVLHDFPEGAPKNRLGLARWLVDPDNPLTARVIVNRFWQQYFGRGLSRTAEDFGALGEMPSHPKLLDWLAVELMESGWDMKHIHELIVNSATYRQSSKMTPELREADPDNKLVARGPHFRLDAEIIRDYALYVSGLMVDQIGGPPVNPYQPKGLWKALAYEGSNTMIFEKDEGEKLYRRSLYTFWKRTQPPPNMMAFDAVTREDCAVRRERTNTPLQALVLMNDIQFVEAARHLGHRILTEGGENLEDRLRYAFELVLTRPPDEEELAIMRGLYKRQAAKYRKDPEAAKDFVQTGDSPVPDDIDPAELAAWTVVGNSMLNLSETISKR